MEICHQGTSLAFFCASVALLLAFSKVFALGSSAEHGDDMGDFYHVWLDLVECHGIYWDLSNKEGKFAMENQNLE